LPNQPKIFVALPLMDEMENIPTLLGCFEKQLFRNFQVVACVNQPEHWWDDPVKKNICLNNQATIDLLLSKKLDNLTVINRSSPGKGWDKKHFGVGWARKTAMDHVSGIAQPEDIILTLDGDTHFSEKYFQSFTDAFDEYPQVKALTTPYFHPLPVDDEAASRAILRYEIYMRHYAINMLRIGNPYAFSALGSAIACSAKTYRSIGGITPHKSGEDFYFVQKLRKFGEILIWLEEKVYPAARFSDRVFFGTGPAMIRGSGGDWSGYPIYPASFFDEIKSTFDAFEHLYDRDLDLPMTAFLTEKFEENFWQPLRDNASGVENFARACRHKVDGLRILQYLKWRNQAFPSTDENNLVDFLLLFYPDDELVKQTDWKEFTFDSSSNETLNRLRDFLTEKEQLWRKTIRILR